VVMTKQKSAWQPGVGGGAVECRVWCTRYTTLLVLFVNIPLRSPVDRGQTWKSTRSPDSLKSKQQTSCHLSEKEGSNYR
jgi:hypothetical protein